ncbi:MAG: phosphoglycolate phosphatase [Hyphomicrobiaceae bacterium]
MASPTLSAGWPRAIVFDLDGTLVDSAPDIQLAINAAFAPLGVAPFGLATVTSMIGGGARAAVERAAALAGLALDDAAIDEALARFYPVYGDASSKGRGLYPGAKELLSHLTDGGIPLGLCTNKAEPITEIALAALGIRHYFAVVVGARDDLPKKPDPTPLQAAYETLAPALRASDVVMIGDTAADIGAARAAGCRSIAITHGYSRVPPGQLGADAVVDRLGAVPEALAKLPRARS